jgi:hypothetical protein
MNIPHETTATFETTAFETTAAFESRAAFESTTTVRPTLDPVRSPPLPRGLDSHTFSHGDITYEVCFSRLDGQWSAVVGRKGSVHGLCLAQPYADSFGARSDEVTRAGYVAVAEWVVRTGPPQGL